MQTGGIETGELDYTDPKLSFKIAHYLPDLYFRQALLALRSEAERLKQISDFLPDYIASMRRSTHIKKVAPKNGHGIVTKKKEAE